jgi:hypothetical protein
MYGYVLRGPQNKKQKIIYKNYFSPNNHCTYTPGPVQYRYGTNTNVPVAYFFLKSYRRSVVCRLRYLSVHNVLAA